MGECTMRVVIATGLMLTFSPNFGWPQGEAAEEAPTHARTAVITSAYLRSCGFKQSRSEPRKYVKTDVRLGDALTQLGLHMSDLYRTSAKVVKSSHPEACVVARCVFRRGPEMRKGE
jgi:hypothetical protein